MSIAEVDGCLTAITKKTNIFLWEIQGFDSIKYGSLVSKTFIFDDARKYKNIIRFNIELRGISIILNILNLEKNENVDAFTQITVSVGKGKQKCVKEAKHLFTVVNNRKVIIFEKEDASLFAGPNLMISCKIDVDHIVHMQNLLNKDTTHMKFSEDFENFFEMEKLCDVTLKLNGGQELKAHKAILAARSDVFAAMFEHKMKEAGDNCVEIMDFDVDVFKEVLRFIYSCKVNKLDEIAERLLIAAEKYDLQDLKRLCGQELALKISIETAIDILILADRFGLHELKDKTINYLKNQPNKSKKYEMFQSMSLEHPKLLKEVFLAIL